MAKAKGKANWLVCFDFPAKSGDRRALDVLYFGPDRKRARSVAERHLRDTAGPSKSDAKASLVVMRVTRVSPLTDDSLVSHLPRDSF